MSKFKDGQFVKYGRRDANIMGWGFEENGITTYDICLASNDKVLENINEKDLEIDVNANKKAVKICNQLRKQGLI